MLLLKRSGVGKWSSMQPLPGLLRGSSGDSRYSSRRNLTSRSSTATADTVSSPSEVSTSSQRKDDLSQTEVPESHCEWVLPVRAPLTLGMLFLCGWYESEQLQAWLMGRAAPEPREEAPSQRQLRRGETARGVAQQWRQLCKVSNTKPARAGTVSGTLCQQLPRD